MFLDDLSQRPDPQRGGSRAGPKKGHRGRHLQLSCFSDRKATATNQIQSNDPEACGKKCCYFWLYPKSIFTRFDVFLDFVIFACLNAISIDFCMSLKLICRHINRRNICFNIKSISVTPGSVKNRFDLELFGSSELTQSTRVYTNTPKTTRFYFRFFLAPHVTMKRICRGERSQISYLSRRCSICKDIRGQ